MPKLLPILTPIMLQRKDLDFLPKFDTFPCEVFYDAKSGRNTFKPYNDFRVRALPQGCAPQEARFETHRTFLEHASDPDLISPSVEIDAWREMLATVSDLTDIHFGVYEFFRKVMENTLTVRESLTHFMDSTEIPRIYIGDGFAFHLMGEGDDPDPAARLASKAYMQVHKPQISAALGLDRTGADFILGISIWGPRMHSAHGQLSLINRFTKVLPRICPALAGLEILPSMMTPTDLPLD